jgi:hypothetical protein
MKASKFSEAQIAFVLKQVRSANRVAVTRAAVLDGRLSVSHLAA